MSPFIVIARPDPEHGMGSAVKGLGRNIAEIGQTLAQARARDRQLDIEEQRAQAALMREQGLAEARQQRADQQASDVQANVEGVRGVGAQAQETNAGNMLEQASRSPNGALGPFGLLNPRAIVDGMKQSTEIKARMEQRAALAERMTPAAGRAYLARAATEEKEAARKQALQMDLQSLQDAVQDGVLDERQAKQFGKALQSAVREGSNPGAIHTQIAKHYDMHAKLKLRAKGWEEADPKAAEMIQAIERTAAAVPDPAIREQIMGKVAAAKAEWTRTEWESFRSKSDADQSLAALQSLLYQAQAQTGQPIDDTKTERAVAERGVREDAFTPERGQERSMDAQLGSQPYNVRKDPRGTLGGSGKPSAAPAGNKQASKRQPDRVLLEGWVQQGAQEALRAGTREDRATRIGALRKKIADDLGLDVENPTVIALVREALQRNYQRGK